METYPSIDTRLISAPIIAFDKLDGSNIRAEWSRKNGFTKFGTRRRLLDPNEKPFGEAIEIIRNKYEEQLTAIFQKQRYERATAFFEFYGEKSFAGFHEDETHTVTLFDLHVYKKGILPAKDFLKLFEDKVEIPKILFEGIPTKDFVEAVKTSTLDGMTFEGAVCKGGLDNRRRPITFKVKSYAWLDRLKNKFGDNEELYKKLL